MSLLYGGLVRHFKDAPEGNTITLLTVYHRLLLGAKTFSNAASSSSPGASINWFKLAYTFNKKNPRLECFLKVTQRERDRNPDGPTSEPNL